MNSRHCGARFGLCVMNSASDKRIPKITVIIPCYNSGTTISRAVDSCLNQSWKNIEIIVVDDGSDDQNTIKQLEKLNSIRLIRQHNLGLPSARNFGAKHAKGDWIIFFHAD